MGGMSCASLPPNDRMLLDLHPKLSFVFLWDLVILLASTQLVLPSVSSILPRPVQWQGPAHEHLTQYSLLVLPVPAALLFPLRGGGADLKRHSIKRKGTAMSLGSGKRKGSKSDKGRMPIREALVSRLQFVSERRARVEEYKRTYAETGHGEKQSERQRVKRVRKINVNARRAQVLAIGTNEGSVNEFDQAENGGVRGGSGQQKFSSAQAGNYDVKTRWVVAGQGAKNVSGLVNEVLQHVAALNVSTSNLSSLSSSAFVFNASSPDGILSELARAGLCTKEDLDLRVRSFMVRLKKQGKTALLLRALREFRDHLSRPHISSSRRVRNKSAVLTKYILTAEREAPKPFNSSVVPPLHKHTHAHTSSEEQMRWSKTLQCGVNVVCTVHPDDLATASHNSTYMQDYPTVQGRRVFTNASGSVEVVLRVERMQKMMFVGVMVPYATTANDSAAPLSRWWGDGDTMTGKAYYVVSNGRSLDGGRLLGERASGFVQGDSLIVRVEMAERRVTVLREGLLRDVDVDGSTLRDDVVLHVFEGIGDAVRVAVQMKQEGDSIRLLETRPYRPSKEAGSALNVSSEAESHQVDGTVKHINITSDQDPRYVSPFQGRKLFVGGTRDLNDEIIESHFRRFGKIATVGVMRNKEGESRGFAFVTYFDIRDANKALKTRVTVFKKEKEFARMQILPCEAPRNASLELDARTAMILREADKRKEQALFHLKLEQMSPDQLLAAEERAEMTECVALDCEMVGVGLEGTEHCVAKVAVCNSKGEPLYVRYVIPTQDVVDYRERITGIRAWHLTKKNGAVSFEQAQANVNAILKDRILVGHNVGHDLEVLLLSHPHLNIRDTAKYKPLREDGRGGQPRLRDLALRILGRKIQEGSHDPFQDAWAAMQIYLKHKNNWDRSCQSTQRLTARRLKRRGPDKRKLRAAQAKAKAYAKESAKGKKKIDKGAKSHIKA